MNLLVFLLFIFQTHAATVKATVTGNAGDSHRIERIHRLTPIVEKVLNSPDFQARMLKAHYRGKPGFQDTSESPESVLKNLLAANWVQEYAFDSAARKVLGWTYPGTKVVWFNSRNFDTREDCGLVGTRFHEETHKRGYRHKNARRPLSVPYYTGTQAALVCRGMKNVQQ